MSARGFWRGHPITFDGWHWRYDEDDVPCHEDAGRACAKCGKPPTPEGHDACLGHLPGVVSACCGHGRSEYAYVRTEP